MATITVDSQIKFRHGSQAALDENIIAQKAGESGTFYLTNDTHRLYVGLSEGEVVPVNEGIVTYASLPSASANKNLAGQFAYIENTGVLAVHNGKQWVHLNPDTNTTYALSGFTADAAASNVQSVTIKSMLQDNNKTKTYAGFTLEGDNGVLMSVTTDGKITVHGAMLVAYMDPKVTNEFTLALADHDTTDPLTQTDKVHSQVKIKGKGNVSVSTESGAIVLTGKSDALDGKIYDTAGTVVTTNPTTGFIAKAKDGGGNTSGTWINPVIKYGANKDKTASFKLSDGIAELDVYSKAEVDAIKQGFDAMTYMGVTSSLPTAGSGTGNGIAKGDTWKVSGTIEVTKDVYAKAGDLLIANGTESGGKLTTVNWEIVESGNEDTQYKLVGQNYGFQLHQGPMGQNFASIGSFKVTAGTDMSVGAGSGHDTSKNIVVANITHANVTRTDPTATTDSIGKNANIQDYDTITVVEGVTTSATGHVTAVTTKKWTIRDTHAVLKSVAASITNSTSGEKTTASAEITVTLDHGGNTLEAKSGSFSIESQNPNLKLGGSGTKITIDLVWGTF